jgi:Spondin_N
MKNIFFIATILYSLTFIVSCKKENAVEPEPIVTTVAPIDSTASYKIIITGTWAMPQHTIPPTEHFTQFVGLIHSEECNVYKLGTLASKGVENVAEIGNGFSYCSKQSIK